VFSPVIITPSLFHTGLHIVVTFTIRTNGLSLGGNLPKKECCSRNWGGMDVKEKFVAVQVWTGPEGCRSLRLPDLI
jgi:hypothetical protein